MKKIVSIVLCLVMCVLMASCSGGAQSGNNSSGKPDISQFKFVEENYYSCNPRFGGNETMVIRFYDVTETSIVIEYYSHDLGNYGKDVYDYYKRTVDMSFNQEKGWYEFEFCGYWRLCTYGLRYNRYPIHQYTNQDFETVHPVDPSDFWWYEEALAQAGN